jgi:hypothetical protein
MDMAGLLRGNGEQPVRPHKGARLAARLRSMRQTWIRPPGVRSSFHQ